jgi:predicted MPP superfamily phosphohydrolase
MNLIGLACAIVIPRIILILFHFTGRFLNMKSKRRFTWAGLSVSLIITLIIAEGVFYGRFNIKTEDVNIRIKGLPANLNGFKIVQISDIHLPAFYSHEGIIKKVMDDINRYEPDLLVNTGDFIDIAWPEFGRYDTIFSTAKGRYGNFAILGNHDIGTYNPNFTEADIEQNISKMTNLITASGYRVLIDENVILNVNGTKLALIGVITRGRHPKIIHGNLAKAIAGTDSADYKILFAHDPNQWEEDVKNKTDIGLTLSGHTHGMQMGIFTKKFRWSPAIFYYPHWGGLFSEGNQFHYVNRGLGVLAIPFRIWMPPEITVITLSSGGQK